MSGIRFGAGEADVTCSSDNLEVHTPAHMHTHTCTQVVWSYTFMCPYTYYEEKCSQGIIVKRIKTKSYP